MPRGPSNHPSRTTGSLTTHGKPIRLTPFVSPQICHIFWQITTNISKLRWAQLRSLFPRGGNLWHHGSARGPLPATRPPGHLDLFQNHSSSPGCAPTSAGPRPAGSGQEHVPRPHHPPRRPPCAPGHPRRHANVSLVASGDHRGSASFSGAPNSPTLHIYLLAGRPPTPPTILEKEAWWGWGPRLLQSLERRPAREPRY